LVQLQRQAIMNPPEMWLHAKFSTPPPLRARLHSIHHHLMFQRRTFEGVCSLPTLNAADYVRSEVEGCRGSSPGGRGRGLPFAQLPPPCAVRGFTETSVLHDVIACFLTIQTSSVTSPSSHTPEADNRMI